ncbi:MAG: hypothetical protein ACI9G1_000134 [Pirellulaceae bacterium]|jgi:hypothetical protein
MQIHSYSSFDDLESIRHQWNQLAGDDVFNQFEWHQCWWQAYGCNASGERELFVVIATDDDGCVAAIAPWYRQRCATRGRVVRFLASQPTRPIRSTVLARPGTGDEALEAIGDWLESHGKQWDAIEFDGVTTDDCRLPTLISSLAEAGTPVYRAADNRRFRIALPRTWPKYVGRFAPATQLELDRIVHDYVKAGRATFEVLSDPAAVYQQCCGNADDVLIDQDANVDTRLCAYLQEAIGRVADLGSLALVLKVDDKIVATQLVLQARQTWHRICYAIHVGDDRDVVNREVADQLSMMMLIHMGIDRGLDQIDLVSCDPLDALAWQGERSNFIHLQLAASTVPHAPLMGLVFSNQGTAKNWCKTGMNLVGLH